ncbi:major capsid protein [Aureliella helgolandensis]|uniref:Phage capsid family protein n=1 Tax=Aureliella helgolandensis TaxID=2527968 RepID=A0A518G4Q6_9BACT|nr:hypothetical protein [Aureliella helgolandensis]QDV23581.1 hypothetical protein Q31a_18830 [Aureliella helgolandensis]
MADSLMTLADIALLNDVSVEDYGATDIFLDAPVLRILPAQTASHGTDHKYLKHVTAPTVGFRAPNAGRDHSKTGRVWVTETLKILDATFHLDAMIAKSNPKGEAFVMAMEAMMHLRAAMKAAERQIFYGTAQDAGGFLGLADNVGLNKIDDDMVLTAGGTSTGVFGDVWMIRATSDFANCAVILGNSGNIAIEPWERQLVSDGDGKQFPALFQEIDGWLGLQVGGAKSVARLVNLNLADGASANTLTDDLLANLMELFPEEAPPTHIVMNKRARKQLMQSRTATNATGAPAPLPTEYEGVPIVTTSACSTYTTAVAAS